MTYNDMDVSDVFSEFEATYTIKRYVITNTYAGESRVSSTHTIEAYIHPDDYKAVTYNGQGDRLEERIKIFVKTAVDIIDSDEVAYKGKNYRVMRDADRDLGGYKKLIGELIK